MANEKHSGGEVDILVQKVQKNVLVNKESLVRNESETTFNENKKEKKDEWDDLDDDEDDEEEEEEEDQNQYDDHSFVNEKGRNILKLKNSAFMDSGVDLPNILNVFNNEQNKTKKEDIPQFYFPKGVQCTKLNQKEYFDQIYYKTKLIFNGKPLNELEFNNITNKCNIPKYLNGALFRKVLRYSENKAKKLQQQQALNSEPSSLSTTTKCNDDNVNISESLSGTITVLKNKLVVCEDKTKSLTKKDEETIIKKDIGKEKEKEKDRKLCSLKLTQLESKLKELQSFTLESVAIAEDSVVKFEDFIEYWKELSKESQNPYYLAFYILKDENNKDKLRNYLDYITPNDFMVVLNDVVRFHPGLKFLINMPIFQQRYSESVIEQLFFRKPQNWNNKMTLAEFQSSKVLENLLYLQIDDDINIHRNLFSYKHFYVIYCKFWEIDTDHDLLVNCYSLFQYDRFSLNTLIIERIIKGYGRKTLLNELNFNHLNDELTYSEYSNVLKNNPCSEKVLKSSNLYQYQPVFHFRDFVWFIMAREDKESPMAIEYWFRCIDLDNDGVISIYEIERFYIEQCKHMALLHITDYWSFPDYCCYLLDIIKPKVPNQITLADLKRSKNTSTFFNLLFDIRQYESFTKKVDGYYGNFDEVWIWESVPLNSLINFYNDFKIKLSRRKLSNWEKYAEKMYDYLANEEVQSDQRNTAQIRKRLYSDKGSQFYQSNKSKKIVNNQNLQNKNEKKINKFNKVVNNDDAENTNKNSNNLNEKNNVDNNNIQNNNNINTKKINNPNQPKNNNVDNTKEQNCNNDNKDLVSFDNISDLDEIDINQEFIEMDDLIIDNEINEKDIDNDYDSD